MIFKHYDLIHILFSQVHKLLLRVIQAGDDSYRVASDSLTHFAAVLSALIHDVVSSSMFQPF